MNPRLSVGLVGDYDGSIVAHACLPAAVQLAAASLGFEAHLTWLATPLLDGSADALSSFDAIWLIPGSPYRSLPGALAAVRFARETGRPFLGTCGGFQHALIEVARSVLGETLADHAESNPHTSHPVIVPLACSLVGQSQTITFQPGSRLESIHAGGTRQESYHCNYGLNPSWRQRLESAGIRFTAFDATGAARAFEGAGQPFFVGTLYQPERSALGEYPHPLIRAFLRAAHDREPATRPEPGRPSFRQ